MVPPPPGDRGIGSLAELVERLDEAGRERTTIEEPVKEPRAGFGDDLDAVLYRSEEERANVALTFAKTLSPTPRR